MSAGIPREPKGAAPPGLTSDEGARREGGAGEGGMGRWVGPGGERENRASGTTQIGFIGLGIMGAPMAANLVKAGFDVAGYNRSPARIEQLVAAGGRGAADIAEAVRDADVVATMVPDSPDVQAVLAGEGGVFEHAQPGALIIDFSSIRPDVAAALAAEGAGREQCRHRRATMQRRTHYDNVPVKPHRVYEEMNRAFGPETRYVSTIGLSQIAAAQFLHVFRPRHWINAGQAGPLGWTVPAALGVCVADPDATVVALSGDYDFQFTIEELAVGAQFNLPYIHVLVNNAYLGLIRQSQRGFDMDYCVQLSFDNVNAPEVGGYGVDHVKVAEGLGCKALRVRAPDEIGPAFEVARKLMAEYRVPVVVEVILERVTNISMGTELDNVVEFEDLAERREDAPTAVVDLLD